MPRGSKSSKGYRSFFKCNDPKGVAEFGTDRISRVSPRKKDQDKDEDQRKHKDLSTLLAEEREMEADGDRIRYGLESSNSLQLVQVSQGAHKLTKSLDSSSNVSSRGARPKDIAQDLLKGAQDLEESLVVLRQLQGSRSDKNHEQKLERGGFDHNGISDLIQFRHEKYKVGLERPCCLTDGSSDSSITEIKKVIKGSRVISQNVAPFVGTEVSYDHVKLDSSSPSNMPSTSPSQATTTNSSSFTFSDSSLSSTASQERTEKSNLIAKLMGLQSLPSSPRRRQIGSGKLLNLRRPLFDIDLPVSRQQPQFPRDETIDGIPEAMRLKGLLTRIAVDGVNHPSSHHPIPRWWIDDDKLPIVIIKPLPFASPTLEDIVIHKPPEDAACTRKALTKVPRSRREPALEAAKHDPSKSETYCLEVEMNSSPIKSHNHGGVPRKKIREKTVGAVAKEKGIFSTKKTAVCSLDEPPKKRDDEVQRAAAAAAARKGVKKNIVKSDNEMRAQDSTKLHASQLKKPGNGVVQTTRIRISKQQDTKSQPVSRCGMESRSYGPNSSSKNTRQGSEGTVTKRAASTGDQGCKGPKIDIQFIHEDKSPHRVAHTSGGGEQFRGEGVGKSETQIRDCKGESSSSHDEIKLMTTHEDTTDNQNEGHNSFYEIVVTNHERGADHSNNRHISTGRHTALEELNEAGNLCQHKDDNACTSKIVWVASRDGTAADNGDSDHNAPEVESRAINAADNLILIKGLNSKRQLKALLLSSPSFVSHAEELFDLKVDLNLMQPHNYTKPKRNTSIACRALVDCANELLELKSRRYAQVRLPLLGPLIKILHLKNTISLDEVLDETCDAIEALRCYPKPSLQTISTDDRLSMLLDRDLKYAGIWDGMWEIGWRATCSADEVDRTVWELEKLVLAGLLEEALQDFYALMS
ncbi:hypothetical protein Dimus_026506 [Dionaea muscipula]